jgi:hypothetical protein
MLPALISVRAEELGKLKKEIIDHIGSRTRDLQDHYATVCPHTTYTRDNISEATRTLSRTQSELYHIPEQ